MGAAASIELWPAAHRELWRAKGHLLFADDGATVDLSSLAWYERESVRDGHLATALTVGVRVLDLNDCCSVTTALLYLVAAGCPRLEVLRQGRERVIQCRFNVGVLEAISKRKASTLWVRLER